jgi:hypothetical protein
MNLLAHVLIAPFGNVADADRYVTGGLNQRGGTPFGAGKPALHHRTLIDHDLTDAQLVYVCPFVMLSVCDRRLEDFANYAGCFSWTELQQLKRFSDGEISHLICHESALLG